VDQRPQRAGGSFARLIAAGVSETQPKPFKILEMTE
jgi:hypothetical protein